MPAEPTAWWSDEGAFRGAVVAAPFGALVALLIALFALGLPIVPALLAYVVGGLLAAAVGSALGGPVGALVRRRRRQQSGAHARSDDGVDLLEHAHAA